MKSSWNDAECASIKNDSLKLRVYSSRLIGRASHFVVQEGGNTSVKDYAEDYFGVPQDTLFVKASGRPLETVTSDDFAPVRMDILKKLLERKFISDSELVAIQQSGLLNLHASNHLVEALLHAVIPFKFVEHSHADAVATLTCLPDAEKVLREIYGNSVWIVPYVKPGFVLAKKMAQIMNKMDLNRIKGIILMHHGILTFHDSAKTSYGRMIRLVTQAENYIKKRSGKPKKKGTKPANLDLKELAQLRWRVSRTKGESLLARWNHNKGAIQFSQIKNIDKTASRGTLIPEQVTRIKPFPMYIQGSTEASLEQFIGSYKKYFKNCANKSTTILDLAPRWAIWPGYGTVSFGRNVRETQNVESIVNHQMDAIQNAESLGGWKPLGGKELFEVEYGELEQVKARGHQPNPERLDGKVALVTGTAAGIGLAVAERLRDKGAVVVGLDISSKVEEKMNYSDFLGIQCDITDGKKVQKAIETTVEKFGGLDILVSNAGTFTAGQSIENLELDIWEKSLKVNLTGAEQLLSLCIPYLRHGLDPAVVFIGSRNVTAPGAGAAAYSVAKAGLYQLARVAALELSRDGIRVNTIHPDAVFDTELWTPEALKRSADRYGMTVEEYKTKNLMKTEITSWDVANMVLAMVGPAFAKTTGAAVPLDGGNERVI